MTDLENTKLDEVRTKIHGASVIYKWIERCYGDLNPLRKNVDDYRSVPSASLSLKKLASMCHHPNDVEKKKAMCAKQAELMWSHLAIVDLDEALHITQEEERQVKNDV